MTTELTPERIRKIREQADLATCCLTMVSVHVTLADGHKFTVPAYPWECFDVAANMRRMGATSLAIFLGRTGVAPRYDDSRSYWAWDKPVRRTRRAA